MSIEQVLDKYSEIVDTNVLKDNISANLKMVFAGNISQISAQMILSRYLPGIDPPRIPLEESKFESPIKGDFVRVQGGFSNFIQNLEKNLDIKIENSAKVKLVKNDGCLIFEDGHSE